MKGLEPSLMDKLFDDAPGSATRRSLSIEEVKDSVARDLEALLNARTSIRDEELRAFPEVARSVATYGLNDFAGLSLCSVHDRAFIRRALEQAIARHEPRLQNVTVVIELDRRSINALYFAINALLVVRPAQEPVSFDAMLQPTTLQYSISRASPGGF